MAKKMAAVEVLDLTFKCDDLESSVTIKEWLVALLARLWDEEERFSGKRPFGNSGWQYDVAPVLIEHKVIDGTIDDEGYLEDCNDEQLHEIIAEAIQLLAC